jgi:D-alanyl-D-alanine carboxypeptidase/D-alanyl-D-alanine-endopeptidase (penicillin-binding protein 4)
VLLAATVAPAGTLLAERIDALLASPEFARGVQGVVIRSLSTGETLYERSPETLLIPASNVKLLTAASALHLLGPDFTFHTRVSISGEIDSQGTLNGSIFVKGGGDPILETPDLEKLAADVRHMGIRRVTGGIVVDDTMFDKVRLGEGWAWDYLPDYYAAQISALNLNRNVVDVYIFPGKAVGPGVRVELHPSLRDYMKVECNAGTIAPGSERTLTVSRKTFENVITVTGGIPFDEPVSDGEEKTTVEEPALYTGHVFRDKLTAVGIRVTGGVRAEGVPPDARLIASHTSRPLSQVLPLFMKPSDNLIGEVLLKTMGSALKGSGTARAGLEAEMEFLAKIGMDPTAMHVVDGSGLSRLNLITARNLVTLLVYMRAHRHSDIFIDSLPVAGIDGTLKRRMRGSPAQGNVRAKTGTLRHASALSGYVTMASGEPLVFSILMNGHADTNAARKTQDRMCAVMAE